MARPLLVILVGPTAIGKTKVAIELAKKLDTEIISADSRQFYEETSIGTAKPTIEEREAVVHHFVDFLSIHDEYSAGDFEREVLEQLEESFESNPVMIMTGGSGLFIQAVTHGFDPLPSNPNIREQLNKQFEESGIESLQIALKEKDPEHFAAMDIHNPQRLIRALEVCIASGEKYSKLRKKEVKKRPFDMLMVGLNTDREALYDRINQRVDEMIENGLIEEAEQLKEFKELNALNTVGYKELFRHFDGQSSRQEAIEEIKKNTRNFAKRQLTWFNKNKDIMWFDLKESDQLIDWVMEQITRRAV